MCLPTINHIDLMISIDNFPLSRLILSANLHRLYIWKLKCTYWFEEEIVVQSETTPKIREFHTKDSSLVTKMLLHAKRQDDDQLSTSLILDDSPPASTINRMFGV